jgi:CRP-like cAMP-binding protein
VNVGRRDALARIAHLFCEMAIRCERAGQGDRYSFALPITQTDLGDATGLTNVHVNRTLKELRTRSLVTAQGGNVTIHNWDQLVAAADFDDAFMLLNAPSRRIATAA